MPMFRPTVAAREIVELLCFADDEEAVKEAIESGRVGVNEAITRRGLTMLIQAAAWDRAETVKFLLRRKDVDVNAQDVRGKTALHHAGEDKTVFTALAMDLRVDLSLKNDKGKTAGDKFRRLIAEDEKKYPQADRSTYVQNYIDGNKSVVAIIEKAEEKRRRINGFKLRLIEKFNIPMHVLKTHVLPCVEDGPAFSE